MCECDFCSDMRNIEPAKYISAAHGEDPDWLVDAKKKHQFIYHYWDDGKVYVVSSCLVDNDLPDLLTVAARKIQDGTLKKILMKFK